MLSINMQKYNFVVKWLASCSENDNSMSKGTPTESLSKVGLKKLAQVSFRVSYTRFMDHVSGYAKTNVTRLAKKLIDKCYTNKLFVH